MLRNFKSSIHTWIEIIIRICLFVAFIKLETVEPFQRKILSDEIWEFRLVLNLFCPKRSHFSQKYLFLKTCSFLAYQK